MPTEVQFYRSEIERSLGRDMDRLRGRICGALEAMGLDEKQERAAIALVKSLSYDAQQALVDHLREDQASRNGSGS